MDGPLPEYKTLALDFDMNKLQRHENHVPKMRTASFVNHLLASLLVSSATSQTSTHNPRAGHSTRTNNSHHEQAHHRLAREAHLLSAARQFTCDSLAYGLRLDDCNYMASIGMLAQGRNDVTDNGRVWIGSDGANLFTFVNAAAGVPMTLVVWYAAPGDDQASFMNVRQPQITYSLPDKGSAVEVSVANGVPGGWSALYGRATALTPYGQIDNTFGEFNSGAWATADVSRLVNMSGDAMAIRVYGRHDPRKGGVAPLCVSDFRQCVYTCSEEGVNSCGETGTYQLVNCAGPHAEHSVDQDGNPTGGCQGWSFGGRLEIILL
ncbi:hypothetical protein VTK26DRAFT_4691 [Humicola hyalothermophila]